MNDLKEWLAGIGNKVVTSAFMTNETQVPEKQHVEINGKFYKLTIERL
ncbi:unnamed protein product [Fructobacillus tropaeoli]|nr:hypothetical protein [Fructobacillus sp. EFB-N1]KMK52622.1 hypothetical protein FEFB_16490 [Fructobacillus sp. EFB-N1]CAK1240231.1 unnamed protein product [Fructobacillus tropaeoli]